MLPMRLLYPLKPKVLHYPETKIRGNWGSRKRHRKHADRILCSTDVLLVGAPENAIYLPNMVDFDKIPIVENKIEKAFFYNVKNGWANDLAMELAKKYQLDLIIHERNDNPLPHEEFLKN